MSYEADKLARDMGKDPVTRQDVDLPRADTTPRTAGDLAGLVERQAKQYESNRDYSDYGADAGDPESIIACTIDHGEQAERIMQALVSLGYAIVPATAITTLQAEVERITKERDEARGDLSKIKSRSEQWMEDTGSAYAYVSIRDFAAVSARAESAEAELARQGAAVAIKPLAWRRERDGHLIDQPRPGYEPLYAAHDVPAIDEAELLEAAERKVKKLIATPATDKGAATEAMVEAARNEILHANVFITREHMRAALNASLGAVSAPAGWVLVPEEPSVDQIRQLFTMNSSGARTTEEARAVYQALLNLAPAAPTVQAGRVEHG